MLFLWFEQRHQERAQTGQAALALQEVRTRICAKYQSQIKRHRKFIFTRKSDSQADCIRIEH